MLAVIPQQNELVLCLCGWCWNIEHFVLHCFSDDATFREQTGRLTPNDVLTVSDAVHHHFVRNIPIFLEIQFIRFRVRTKLRWRQLLETVPLETAINMEILKTRISSKNNTE